MVFESDPPSPRSAKLMASLAKQMDKLQRNVERRMGERFDEIRRSTQELSGRMEDIERRGGIVGHLILLKEVMMAMKKVEGIDIGGIGMKWMM